MNMPARATETALSRPRRSKRHPGATATLKGAQNAIVVIWEER